jgi:peroxiredoxin
MLKFLPCVVLLAFAPLAWAAPSFDPAKPLQMRFTALGGKQVDLADYRGKVVLIDFWSSTNKDCRQNEFQVVRAYKKYHDRGFDIIGISFDTDKDAFLTLIQNYGIYWPQYFDGLGKNNRLASQWGVTSIPTMWLVDQKGMVVNTNVGDDLAGQVKKLLMIP